MSLRRPWALTKRLAARILPPPLLLRAKKAYYARALVKTPSSEEPDLRMLPLLVEPGDTVVDVGANVGLYTYHLSRLVGPAGTVLSVEPIPHTFEILESNVRRLRLSNVRPRGCAISDRAATSTMTVPPYSFGGVNYHEAHLDSENPTNLPTIDVRTETLDSLCAESAARPSFIKVDVEGDELAALQGATRVLDDAAPSWLIEVNGDVTVDGPARELVALMRRRNYSIHWFDGERLHAWAPGSGSVNLFFLQPVHLRVLGDRSPAVRP